MPRYDARRIETKWQEFWDKNQTFRTPDEIPTDPDAAESKLYVLDMFPYPSGSGLHVGHPEGYTATDIVCRYSRMKGKHVLHPMGWDAFGLPAEQHAIQTGTHPRITTAKNIDTFRRQLKMLGFSYDWKRELGTIDPDYFRWTQWIFLELFDTWYDPNFEWTDSNGTARTGKGRPISELPIPPEVEIAGEEAIRRYKDSNRLAYQHEAPVNWCPALGTVLSNEEVNAEGKSERGQHPVVRKPLRQWMLRITAYADRLENDLEQLDWSESIKILQRNWIGRSEGAEVDFFIGDSSEADLDQSFETWKKSRAAESFPKHAGDDVLRIYTTRPDTIFGATYMVLAPEHPFVERLTTDEQKKAVKEYCRKSSLKSDLDRTDLAKEKTGVFTGSNAVNPANGKQIPIWIADYVLISYGTGAIMAVPGQDERDWEFAEVYDLDIVRTVQPSDEFEGKAYLADGPAIASDFLNGLHVGQAKVRMIEHLERTGLGRSTVNYRLRDWLFSRQHFWGEPFPIWHELDAEGNMTGLMRTDAIENLPITLPDDFEFQPHGASGSERGPEPPLADSPHDWLYRTDDDGTKLKRETNTMPQWAGSCWYYLRFCDPSNDEAFVDPAREKFWMPVDLYIGGAEHAVLHLLYARFWHKVLFDRGYLSTIEPFQKLVNQGMILGEAEFTGYKDDSGNWVSAKDVEEATGEENATTGFQNRSTGDEVSSVRLEAEAVQKEGENFVLKDKASIVVESRAYKMSKSRGNVINPDDIVAQFGTDSLRLFEMFMGPLEQMKPWSMSGVEGVFRFLRRVWRMCVDERDDNLSLNKSVTDSEPTNDQLRILHKTIKAVTQDIEKLSFNTAISRMMEFTNEIGPQETKPRSILEPFVLLLAPFAPHICEELWELFGKENSLAYVPWPEFDEKYLLESEIEIPVQVNGKLRGKITVPVDANRETMQQLAESDEGVAAYLAEKNVVKVVVVPGRMVNFVVKG